VVQPATASASKLEAPPIYVERDVKIRIENTHEERTSRLLLMVNKWTAGAMLQIV
tara:strand:+ start:85 stop:249 length:165 start_codon:yes stop_codon:yes gene_type:complete